MLSKPLPGSVAVPHTHAVANGYGAQRRDIEGSKLILLFFQKNIFLSYRNFSRCTHKKKNSWKRKKKILTKIRLLFEEFCLSVQFRLGSFRASSGWKRAARKRKKKNKNKLLCTPTHTQQSTWIDVDRGRHIAHATTEQDWCWIHQVRNMTDCHPRRLTSHSLFLSLVFHGINDIICCLKSSLICLARWRWNVEEPAQPHHDGLSEGWRRVARHTSQQ